MKRLFILALLISLVSITALEAQRSSRGTRGTAETEAVIQSSEKNEEVDTRATRNTDSKKETMQSDSKATSSVPNYSGTVVSLTELALGSANPLSAEKAKSFVDKGFPIGLMHNGTFYLVYNADGSYGGANLAKKAGGNVTVYGQKKTVKGVHVIIADLIK